MASLSSLRIATRAGIALAMFFSGSVCAQTQAYPAKPIRMIAPVSPGAGADTAARLLARVLSESMRQQVVIDHRPGAGSVLGTSLAAKATPDGYSILWVSSAHAINAAFQRDLPYDSLRDFEPVALLARMPLILVVHQGFAAKSASELLALLRAAPGKYNYASSGVGSGSYLAQEMLKLAAQVDMVNVSYKGAAPSLAALLGGEVQMAMVGPLSAKPHIASGKLRALAVSTSRRSSALPEVPTLREAGVPNYEMTNWYGLLAPAGTLRAAVTRLNEEVNSAQRDKALAEAMTAEGAELPATTPAQFGEYLQAEVARYRELSKSLGVRLR